MDVLVLIVVVLVTISVTKAFLVLGYWRKKNVKQQFALPFLGSNTYKLILGISPFLEVVMEQYKQFPKERYHGLLVFQRPALLIKDLQLIKKVTVKDFDHFVDHQLTFRPESDPHLGLSLFFLSGQKWKDIRSTLSPVFTSSKLKGMYNIISECAEQYAKHFEDEGKYILSLEMKDTFTRFANDVIATAAFGIECNSVKEKENKFYTMGKNITNFGGFVQQIKFLLSNLLPELTTALNMSLISKEYSQYFKEIIVNTMSQREKKNIVRNDLIHLLMEMKKGKLKHEEQKETDMGFATVEESNIGKQSVNIEVTEDVLVAQALLFFFAGFDTISTALSFCAYELALNQDVQEKLHAEIDEVLKENNGKLPYEEVAKMKYLDMVFSETLRKWPPIPQIDRVCTKSYVITPEGNEEVIVVEKGQAIIIPVYGIHMNPEYFPNPTKFNPDRFSVENRNKIIPYSYMPFGSGPRNCIGSRFALLEGKLILINLLSKLKIVTTDKTPLAPKFEKGFGIGLLGGFWVGLKPRNK